MFVVAEGAVAAVADEEHHIHKCSCSYMNKSDFHFGKDLMDVVVEAVAVAAALVVVLT